MSTHFDQGKGKLECYAVLVAFSIILLWGSNCDPVKEALKTF